MARHVFFSFHYQRDVWRINQIRNLGEIVGNAAAGFHDASLWEEAKKKGDATIKKMIDDALHGTSVTVVFIGYQTAGRKYINYEIEKSIERGNGFVGIQIHELRDRLGQRDPVGKTPTLLTRHGVPIYKYVSSEKLKQRIEQAAQAANK
jgi:antiphage defense system Thoeris ThsB-like protein